jgi:hypothetical protein
MFLFCSNEESRLCQAQISIRAPPTSRERRYGLPRAIRATQDEREASLKPPVLAAHARMRQPWSDRGLFPLPTTGSRASSEPQLKMSPREALQKSRAGSQPAVRARR